MTGLDRGTLVPDAIVALLTKRFPDRGVDELESQLDECVKFLILASRRSCAFIPLTHEVDEIWHELILQTQFYAELCGKLPGRRYLHHRSIGFGDYARPRDPRDVAAEFASWLPDYVEQFGPFTEAAARHWTICRYLRAEFGLGLDEINAMGARSWSPTPA